MKDTLNDLAIMGGSPLFIDSVHVGRPNIGDRQRLLERIGNILDRRWLTNNGPYVQEFEQRIAEMIGVKHCIAVCNCTVGLEIAIRAAGLTGEVIVPSMTFIATAHSLQWQGIAPVFCDIDPETHNLDPELVEGLITPRTTGIIGVHLWGRPCDADALAEIAQRRNLRLLYDAAHAFGCSYKRRMIGSLGDAEVLSFHATKFLNCFEGGAVVTNADDLAKSVRLMNNFGFAGYDDVVSLGTNGKMSEVSAAMGLTGLESLPDFVAANVRNYQQYRRELAGVPGIGVIAYDERERCNYQYCVIEVDEAVTHVSRDCLQRALWAENVLARRYFYPGCHRAEPYQSLPAYAGVRLPHTERLVQRVLCLPTGTAVGPEEISPICNVIRVAVAHGREITKRLASQNLM